MTAEIVNLNKVRKAKARAEKERQAAENRARHGLSKAERQKRASDEARRQQELNGALRGDGGETDLDPGTVS